VTDPQGAVVAGASVRAINQESLATIETTTDDSGRFMVPFIPAGRYQIVVHASGFNIATSGNINLSVGQAFAFNVQLAVGSSTTKVEVRGGGPIALETDNAEISGTITGKEVTSIGLNGRNFTQFINLVAGVSNQTGQDEAKVGQAGSVSYAINGGRTEYNSFSMDGSELLNTGMNKDHSTLIVTPSIDSIQEIKVLTSNYGAQYPSTGSGTTIVTTKSGTDQYHGEVYDFVRNEMFNAKGYFDVTSKAPLYRRQDFGGTIGGPLSIPRLYNAKGKTLFFVSEESRLEKTPTAYRQAVPSVAERNNDFSDVCNNFTGNYTDTSLYPDCPGSNSQYRVGYVNSNAKAILDTGVIPYPNASSGCNTTTGSCYNVDVSLPTNWREDLFRLDHTFSPKLQAMFRYVHDEWNETASVPPYGYVQNSFPTILSDYYGPGTSMVARFTSSLTPTWLNEFVASYTDSYVTLTNIPGNGVATLQRPAALDSLVGVEEGLPESIGTAVSGSSCYTYEYWEPGSDPAQSFAGDQCPMTNIFANGAKGTDGVSKIPGVSITGSNAAYGGTGFGVDAGYNPWKHTNPIFSIADNVTKMLGRHELQFGGQWVRYQRDQDNTPIGAATGDTQGILTFNGSLTGNAFADYLYYGQATDCDSCTASTIVVGGVSSFQQDSAQPYYRQRYQIAEPYIQDNFKVNHRLTVNVGLRMSLFGTFRELGKSAYNWDPAQFNTTTAKNMSVTSGGALLYNSNAVDIYTNTTTGTVNPLLLNGIVHCGVDAGTQDGCMSSHWLNPSPRVGFAWDPLGDGKSMLRGGYGIFFEHGTADEANTGSLEASAPMVLDMTVLNPYSWSELDTGVTAYPINVTSIPRKAVWSNVQQWSLSIERELPRSSLLTVAYVGSKGTHLTDERQINQLKPVSASQNPFHTGQPLIKTGDCTNKGTSTAPIYDLLNGTVISSSSPIYQNMAVICGQNADAFRPYMGLGQIYSLENSANSSYHALQATLRHTLAPLSLGVVYTYSHSLDDASDRSDSTFVNSYSLASNRASSNFDQRHMLNISYVYDLPLLRAWQSFASAVSRDPDTDTHATDFRPPSAFGLSRLERNLFDHWQLSGITLYQTGTPFSIINEGNTTGVGQLDNAGVANGVGSGSYVDMNRFRNKSRYHSGKSGSSEGPLLGNPDLFSAPQGLTFGNSGRNSMNNPSRLNFDTALLKHFKVTESSDLEFRAEAFNVFNHTQFRIYDPLLGNQSENTANCYGGAASNYSAAGGDGTDCLTGSGFLHPVDAHRPRTMQFALKLAF
jgi:ribosomal protein L25 (general stress protein Ctc)